MKGHRFLIVDDDPAALKLVKIVLKNSGFEVTEASSVGQAQGILEKEGTRTFSGVFSDYRMPDATGLDLLQWVQERDSTLSIVLFTAENDRQLVASSLRGGALDFLDKPLHLDQLRNAASRAVSTTEQKRILQDRGSAVEKVVSTHRTLFNLNLRGSQTKVIHRFYPLHDAGGDFINFRPMPQGGFLLLAGDVSGHDLEAAFVSTYFQGVVCGMLQKHSRLQEILEFFNRHLCTDWASVQAGSAVGNCVNKSISVCAAIFGSEGLGVTLFNHGFPVAIMVDQSGRVQPQGASGTPLGWFDELDLEMHSIEAENCGTLYLWSDGLEDFAQELQISAGAAAYRLLHATQENERPQFLEKALDDVLTVCLCHQKQASDTIYHLILWETLSADQSSNIDHHHQRWHRSLEFALPDCTESFIYNVTMSCREAVLNGMIHGCNRNPDQNVVLEISYNSTQQSLRVHISDSGPGFEVEKMLQNEETNFENDAHRGLLFIKCLASHMEWQKSSSTLILDFALNESALPSPTSSTKKDL
jgi:FixJ family two-component response regulator/anti-sigma regulatory factor (Ser/Thr protein kinase)